MVKMIVVALLALTGPPEPDSPEQVPNSNRHLLKAVLNRMVDRYNNAFPDGMVLEAHVAVRVTDTSSGSQKITEDSFKFEVAQTQTWCVVKMFDDKSLEVWRLRCDRVDCDTGVGGGVSISAVGTDMGLGKRPACKGVAKGFSKGNWRISSREFPDGVANIFYGYNDINRGDDRLKYCPSRYRIYGCHLGANVRGWLGLDDEMTYPEGWAEFLLESGRYEGQEVVDGVVCDVVGTTLPKLRDGDPDDVARFHIDLEGNVVRVLFTDVAHRQKSPGVVSTGRGDDIEAFGRVSIVTRYKVLATKAVRE